MAHLDNNSPLTRDDCRQVVEESVFRLRPPDYCSKYPKWPGQVGLEIEVLALRGHALDQYGKPALVSLHEGQANLGTAIEKIASDQGWNCDYFPEDKQTGTPQMLKGAKLQHGDNLSFEPGGQFEYSSIPYPCLNDALKRMTDVQAIFATHLSEFDIGLLQVGMNPWQTPDEVGLQMPKARYRAMDQYFRRIGPYGPRMMRQTCTVQVNLDFGPDGSTLAKRYLLGHLLAPIATATFANSPIVDGRLTDYASFRSLCWRHIDPLRTGAPDLTMIAKTLTKQACVDAYLDFLLAAPVIFVTEANYALPQRVTTFAEWLQQPLFGLSPTRADLDAHLSLLFPEARPRGFIELRSVDSQSRVWQAVPAAYYTGLLYDGQALDAALTRLLPLLPELGELLQAAARGLRDQRLGGLALEMMTLAREGFSRLPTCFKGEETERALQVYAQHFVERQRTPADDIVDLAAHGAHNFMTRDFYDQLHASWQNQVTQ